MVEIKIDVIQVIQVGFDVIRIDVIQIYRIFAHKFFNLEMILAVSIFVYAVVSRVFTFTFRCAMPRRAPFRQIIRPSVKDTEDPDDSWWDDVTTFPPDNAITPDSITTIQTRNLWRYATGGYLWVHRPPIIPVSPKTNTHFVTTLPNYKGEVLITVSLSINGSNLLVSVTEHFV